MYATMSRGGATFACRTSKGTRSSAEAPRRTAASSRASATKRASRCPTRALASLERLLELSKYRLGRYVQGGGGPRDTNHFDGLPVVQTRARGTLERRDQLVGHLLGSGRCQADVHLGALFSALHDQGALE